MSILEEKLAKSLTADSVELIPYLPYLLQDLWELGSSPNDMIALMSTHITLSKDSRILDLACGKGAVSVQIAKKFGCAVKGVDLMSEFIEYAKQKALEFDVTHLCDFLVGDINEAVEVESNYDVVILGAVGDVLGSQEETLRKLAKTIKKHGYVVLDDGYAKTQTFGLCPTKEQWMSIVTNTGFEWIADVPGSDEDLSRVLDEQMDCLLKRTQQLKERYPEKAHLFDQYMVSQYAECDELTQEIQGVTMLLKKR